MFGTQSSFIPFLHGNQQDFIRAAAFQGVFLEGAVASLKSLIRGNEQALIKTRTAIAVILFLFAEITSMIITVSIGSPSQHTAEGLRSIEEHALFPHGDSLRISAAILR